MSWINLYAQYFLIYFLFLLSFYLMGKLVVSLVGLRLGSPQWTPYEDIFASLVIGTIFCVCIFSLWITHLHTVNLLFLFIIGLLFLGWRANKPTSRQPFFPPLTVRQVLELFVYAFVLYTFFALAIIRRDDWSSILAVPHLIDWGLYSVDARTMLQTGQENSYHVLNLLDKAYWGMTPYHYFELWMTAIERSLFPGLLPIYLFSIVIYPICGFLALLGTWAVLECLITTHWHHRLLALLCFYTAGWFFINRNIIPTQAPLALIVANFEDMNHFLFFLPKRLIAYIMLQVFLLLFLRQKYVPAFISLLILPVVSTDSIPGIVGGAVFFLILYHRRKPRQALHLTMVYFVFSILFLLLYRTLGNSKILLYSPAEVISRSLQSGILFPSLFFARALVGVLILYSFHLWVLYKSIQREKEFKSILLLLFAMLFFALFSWSVFLVYIDSIQFFVGLLSLIQTLVLIFGLAVLSKKQDLPRVLLIVYVVISASYNLYANYFPIRDKNRLPFSEGYLEAISQIQPKSPLGISLQAREDFETDWAMRHVVTHALGDSYLIFMPDYLKAMEMGVFDIPETPFRARPQRIPLVNIPIDFKEVDIYRSKIMKESGIFYRFYQERKVRNAELTVEEAQIQFIDFYKIDWGIISRNVEVSPSFLKRIERTIRDPLSGERFILLRNK